MSAIKKFINKTRSLLDNGLTNRFILIWILFGIWYFLLSLLYVTGILATGISPVYRIHTVIAVLSHASIISMIFFFILLPSLRKRKTSSPGIITSVIMMLLTLVTIVDIAVYKIYNFHFNGYIISEMMQPKFIESSGISAKVFITTTLEFIFAAVILFILIQVILSGKLKRITSAVDGINLKKITARFLIGLVILEKVIMLGTSYGRPQYLYRLRESLPVLYFNPVIDIRKLIKINGLNEEKETFVNVIGDYDNIVYPMDDKDGTFKNKYNVVILSMESVRYDFLKPEYTPYISGFADSKAILMKRHFGGSNSTHLSVFPMLYAINPYYQVYVKANKVQSYPITVLRRNGYYTAYMMSTSPAWHRMDYYLNQNFDDVYIPGDEDLVAGDKKMTEFILNKIGSFSRKKSFIVAHYSSSHYPYSFPKEFARYTPYLDEPFDKSDYIFLEKVKNKLINSYINSLLFLDNEIGKVLARLEATGHMKDTIVIITSDHGCEYGEYGHFFYSSALNNYQINVPLIIYYPGIAKPATIETPSTHYDILPTVFDIMGYSGSCKNMQGQSMLKNRGAEDYVIVAYQDVFEPKAYSLINPYYKLTVDFNETSLTGDMTDINDNPVDVIPDRNKRIEYLFKSINYFKKTKK